MRDTTQPLYFLSGFLKQIIKHSIIIVKVIKVKSAQSFYKIIHHKPQ